MQDDEKAVLAKMASLLKSGATMLDKTCPRCGVPLFRLKSGEVVCPKCGQKYVIVTSDEEEIRARSSLVLQSLEQTIVEKLQLLQGDLSGMTSPEEIYDAGRAIMMLLQILETSYKVRSLARPTAGEGQR